MQFRRFIQGVSWVVFVQMVASGKRILEWIPSFIVIVLLFPFFILLYLIVQMIDGSMIRVKRLGRWREPFDEYMFSLAPNGIGRLILWLHVHRLPALLNIFKGDMSFIGPRVVGSGEIRLREHAVRKRYNVRPGLICLWWIRRRANIAYGNRPFIPHVGQYLILQGVTDFDFVLSHLPEKLETLLGDGQRWDSTFRYHLIRDPDHPIKI